MPLHFDLLPTASPDAIAAVHALLRDFNQQHNPAVFCAPDDPAHAARDLTVLAQNETGQVIAGLLAETRLAWLKIHILAVDPAHRRTGIGRQLVRLAETEALRRGCRHSFLDTMDYQAPAFYHALGYITAGSIPNWDSHGHTKLFLTRDLTPTLKPDPAASLAATDRSASY